MHFRIQRPALTTAQKRRIQDQAQQRRYGVRWREVIAFRDRHWHNMKPADKVLSRQAFLRIVGGRLESNLNVKDLIVLSKLYADVAGWKNVKQKARRAKQIAEDPPEPKEPTMSEMILQLEKESKNGQ